MHFLIVNSNYYKDLSQELGNGARRALKNANATFEEELVPGALEIPTVIRFALEKKKFHGFIALGTVIRGETSHYDIVCNESARGLTWLGIEHSACIGNGILTVENIQQAWERARLTEGDKGGVAAQAALHLATVREKYRA